MIIGLSGSKGRMGQEILSILQERNIDTILNDVGDSKAEMFDKCTGNSVSRDKCKHRFQNDI